ncbi:MAG: MFS transporter [Proteobacteria bacterium]|nr:MFS transporter [Pseudomonadota bacterium]
MSAATGLTVASNYYAQPLLNSIGAQFGLPITTAGSIVTVAQFSYAIGLILLVPLGDMVERKTLIVIMTILSACGLLITAFASNIFFVIFGTAIAGVLSVMAQIMIPFASDLALAHERGKVVGTIMSGLLMGILLARTAAGFLADLGSWRTVYWVAATLMFAMAYALWLALPRFKTPITQNYLRILTSIFYLYRDEPLFRARSMLGAILFASFSLFWTSLTFLLTNPPYEYSTTVIGLFGLAGIAGAYAAKKFGSLADLGYGNRTTVVGLLLLLISWIPVALGQNSIITLLIGVVMLDLAIQGVHVTNLSAIYRLNSGARSRLTSGIMTANFIGASAGSIISSWVFVNNGWYGICLVGVAMAVVALIYAFFASNIHIPKKLLP